MSTDDSGTSGEPIPPDWVERLLSGEIENEPTVHEPTALERQREAERAERARRLRERLDTTQPSDGYLIDNDGRAYWPTESAPAPARRKKRPYLGILSILTVMTVLLSYVSFKARTSQETANAFTPLTEPGLTGGSLDVDSANGPAPQPAESDTRLAPLPQQPPFDDSFRFIETQRGVTQPVAYDPCRPVHYVVNPSGAPEGGAALIAESIARISEATGLVFVDDGSTDEPPSTSREPFQPERYGDVWAPVVIWWSSPDVVTELEGDVAGIGGSVWIRADQSDDQSGVLITGSVTLDSDQLATITGLLPNGPSQARAVVLHELAHVIGLDHVDDTTQIMNPVGSPLIVDFNTGDLNGLRALGNGRCFEKL